jgi:endonuclease/exonuclease/phosphatase family metal-dependent hydrolase
VLPYRNEPGGHGQRAVAWSRFEEELKLQTEDWMTIRAALPDVPLVVAGDLNQSLDGSRWYESARMAEMLRRSLDQAGLTCVTTEDAVATGKLRTHHLIDHSCISEPLVLAGEVSCWEPTRSDGVVLSDHPGVAVALTR